MNDSRLWAKAYGYYEHLKVMVETNDSRSWAQSCELRAIDTMNILGLWLTLATLGHKIRALNTMKNSGLSMAFVTLGHKLRVLDAMNSS